MSAKQSAGKRRQWRDGKYRNRKQVKQFWATAVVWCRAVFEHDRQAVHRIRWAIARDQLRSD